MYKGLFLKINAKDTTNDTHRPSDPEKVQIGIFYLRG